MVQGQAHQWIHVLLPALLAALRTIGEAPARSLTALAQRLGGSAADAATVVVPLEEPAPLVAVPAAAPASPLLPMTGRNGASSAPKTLLNRPHVRAARNRTIRSNMSCESMPPAQCSASAQLMQGVCTISASRRLPRIPDLPGVDCGRSWASWRAHSPRSRS